jgi:hypothetical protein
MQLLRTSSLANTSITHLSSLISKFTAGKSRPFLASRPNHHHRSIAVVTVEAAFGGIGSKKAKVTEADLYAAIDPPKPLDLPPSSTTPWYTYPLTIAGVLFLLRTIGRALRRSRNGSSSALADRGYKSKGLADENHYNKLMKSMRKTNYEELSDDAISAARRRRQREVEREGGAVDLEKIELPSNHPFAMKREMSMEEEENMKARSSARRRLSAEDMKLLREQQAFAAQMDAESD